jgi:undecaprenyl diphosphate synthase
MAKTMGLVGYAKNLDDGSVEIVAEGEESRLWELLSQVQRGSFLARVDGMEYHIGKGKGEFREFEIVRDRNLIADQVKAFGNLTKRFLNRKSLTIPRHVVIIPDGNRRWAKQNALSLLDGYKAGIDRFKELIKAAKDSGVETITLWGFSTENWKRSDEENKILFGLAGKMFDEIAKEIVENDIRFNHIGRKDRLPKELIEKIGQLEERTKQFNKYTLNLALDYGGRDDILRAIKKLFADGKGTGEITEEVFSKYLDTKGQVDPDLIIRTSGELRTSGILPWQGTYAELYFSPLYFPDFDKNAFQLALLDYSSRQRRFGGK